MYKIECVPCRKEGKVTQYLGESGFSAHSRGALHRQHLIAEDGRSVLWEHAASLHGADRGDGVHCQENYKMEVIGTGRTASRRLIREAVEIESAVKSRDVANSRRGGVVEERVLLNGHSQWFQPRLVRVHATSQPKY